MKLDALAVGDIITQFVGPMTGVNYGGSATAYCEVITQQLAGSAAVKIQYNISPILGVDNTNTMLVPDPAQWVDVATISTSTVARQAITVRTDLHWLRVVVSHVGTGTCVAGGRWARRGA